jgi:RES domain
VAVLFRNADSRYGFTREDLAQPPARWHGPGDGPVQYMALTPEGAWAEFLRHEGITEVDDLQGVTRRVWAIEVPDELIEQAATVDLPDATLLGGEDTYPECQEKARTLRDARAAAIRVPSAALEHAGGYKSTGSGLTDGDPRDAENIIVFGSGADWTGWMCHHVATADPHLLARVRPLLP